MLHDFARIMDAFEFVSFGQPCEHEAFLDLDTGDIYCRSEYAEEEFPEDIDSRRCLEIPHKNDLDLGSMLALRFAEEMIPEHAKKVSDFFHAPGAFRRFKGFLEHAGKLDDWFKYEADATEKALRDWCAENGVELK